MRRTTLAMSTGCHWYSIRPARDRRSRASMMLPERETAVRMKRLGHVAVDGGGPVARRRRQVGAVEQAAQVADRLVELAAEPLEVDQGGAQVVGDAVDEGLDLAGLLPQLLVGRRQQLGPLLQLGLDAPLGGRRRGQPPGALVESAVEPGDLVAAAEGSGQGGVLGQPLGVGADHHQPRADPAAEDPDHQQGHPEGGDAGGGEQLPLPQAALLQPVGAPAVEPLLLREKGVDGRVGGLQDALALQGADALGRGVSLAGADQRFEVGGPRRQPAAGGAEVLDLALLRRVVRHQVEEVVDAAVDLGRRIVQEDRAAGDHQTTHPAALMVEAADRRLGAGDHRLGMERPALGVGVLALHAQQDGEEHELEDDGRRDQQQPFPEQAVQ
jgi:hypothetical protein